MENAKIWEESVIIPTYETGEPDRNPMFLEKRVYQGSSGQIYPYPTIDKIYDTKINKEYHAVYMENKYLKIMILPELGGRIQRAYDKTNNYDFIYYNHVIKPALVGLCGPWISGGIEFNWPQHHRPTTFSPVDHIFQTYKDGSVCCRMNDVDQINGTKGEILITLHPDKAYIEVKGQLYNRTSLPQTFLWWANPALAANDHTQSIFPPDVHAVMDHGKRDVSRFPIATGTYYKHDYSTGVDISRYKNIPVPTSYMAEKSKYDFIGGYDYGINAGMLHIADHHISPGKKQWTWGCGDFGKAWDRNLTDSDGPYVELMTGVFTDNQPDFTWLKPMEEKTFTQYFMPYKEVGSVKNATIHALINLEITSDNTVNIKAYSPEIYPAATVRLICNGNSIFSEEVFLSPEKPYFKSITVSFDTPDSLTVLILNGSSVLVSYTPEKKEINKLPSPAAEADMPSNIRTNEELYLTGLHIEQYRHATYLPDPYYLEGLKRDPDDIRLNNAYGSILIRRGQFSKAIPHFKKAIARCTWKNPNPYNSESYYNLGLACFYLKDFDNAYEAFYKSIWSNEQKEYGYYYLSCINAIRGEYQVALEMVEQSLLKNLHNIKARGLKAYLLRKLDKKTEFSRFTNENLQIDPFDYLTLMETAEMEQLDGNIDSSSSIKANICKLSRNYHETFLMCARDYAEFGAYDEACDVISMCTDEWPMLFYYKAYYIALSDNSETGNTKMQKNLERAMLSPSKCCFPNKLEDINVLEYAISNNEKDSNAPYYLGCLYYNKKQYKTAILLWENSVKINNKFPVAWRCLSIAYYNKLHDPKKALSAMEKAWSLDHTDSRIFMELDQLYKKLSISVKQRLANYEKYHSIFMQRDDTKIEYVTMLNQSGNNESAYSFLTSNHFHPWEGGEGKVTTQYVISLVELGRKSLLNNDLSSAKDYFLKSLTYPENLGEGKLEGCKDNNIYYYLGIIEKKLGNSKTSEKYFQKASYGISDPSGSMYYNDQPADMILYQGLAKAELGMQSAANADFIKLLDYGEQHLYDEMKIGYFAVSLPDFQIFEDDLDIRNKAHCWYLMGLSQIGLHHNSDAANDFEKALSYNPDHQNAKRYLKML